MIYTSYFEKLRKMPKNIIPIAICAKVPDWYTGLQYKKLAPKYEFFNKWKQDHNNEEFVKCYKEQVLDQLDAHKVINELYEMLPEPYNMLWKMVNCPCWENPYVSIALICYEKPSDFCHRHLVADWLNDLLNYYRIKCEEWNESNV